MPLLSHNVVADAAGGFVVDGAAKRGVPVGRYKVVVAWIVPRAGSAADKLKGQFTLKNTPLVIEVPAEQEILIDVGAKAK